MLSGRTAGFKKELEKQMHEAAGKLEFERAADLRDALTSLDVLESEPAVMDFRDVARDYIDYVASGRHVVFAVMQMRGGQITGRELYMNEYAGTPSEALPEFLLQYYAETGRERPGRLYLPEHPGEDLERFFSENEGCVPKILVPADKKDMAI